MKGIISGIKRMEIHDGAGLRTTVFFKGCPLRCIWCHNPESLSPAPQIAFFEAKCCGCGSCKLVCPEEAADGGVDFSKCSQCLQCAQVCPTGALTIYGQEYEADELAELLMQDAVFFETSGGGVTLSGGECLLQTDFAVELAQKLHQKGISVDVDTCGFVARSALERILPYTDEFLYDLKAIDTQVHRKCTGQDNAVILENLKFLLQHGCKVEIRYPLVVGFNDGECQKIGQFLQNLKFTGKIKVLQYHSFAKSRYTALGIPDSLPDTQTTFEDVSDAVEILKAYGLNAVNGITED